MLTKPLDALNNPFLFLEYLGLGAEQANQGMTGQRMWGHLSSILDPFLSVLLSSISVGTSTPAAWHDKSSRSHCHALAETRSWQHVKLPTGFIMCHPHSSPKKYYSSLFTGEETEAWSP